MSPDEVFEEAQQRLRESEIRKRRVLLGLPRASEIRTSLARLAAEAKQVLEQAEAQVDDFDWQYLERLDVISDVQALGEYVEQSTALIDGLQQILGAMRADLDALAAMFGEEVSVNAELEAEALAAIRDYLKRWT